MSRILLTIAYEGSAYAGWQMQSPTLFKPTIQGCLEEAVQKFLLQRAVIHGAGRTDSGVHALGQRAHFDCPPMPPGWDWRKRLNAVLPADIRILAAENVPDDFHALRDAVSKTYFYQFWTEPDWTPPHLRGQVWPCGRLDAEIIQSVLPSFLGSHDFASFQNSGTAIKSTIREITAISLEAVPVSDYLPPHAPLLRLTITGSGFLKQMVRNIAGYLKAVGAGKLSPLAFGEIMSARSRAALSTPTAPARGLFMARVNYDNRKPV